MVNAFFYSNTAQQTTLSGSISAGATSINVGATTGFPGSFPYVLALDYGAATEELVKVTAAAATTLTVERGYGGTSAQSHSLGAVIRHVYNAIDATDFRTHEAATSDVHGVTGALVGATMVQTLSNKTLTSPTINSGALSGTFTGNATYTGELTHSNLYRGTRALATDSQLEARVTGDANARWFMRADGQMSWGPGSTAVDTVLYREAASTLATDDQFRSKRPSGTDVTWISQRSADTGPRWYMTADGVATWGDGAGAMDTNLYRQAANVLTTDDIFRVVRSATSDNAFSARITTDTTASHWFMNADGAMWWGAGGTTAADTTLYRSAADTLKTDDSLEVAGTITESGTGIEYRPTQTGTTTISFTSQTSFSQAFSFPIAFDANPTVTAIIRSGAGSTIGFMIRVLSISTTGATINVATNGSAQTWSSVPVDWTATAA
ncbi:hypothetical protein [Streptomyces formicae]|uniref:Uncharacterized protein n=1 Tax=Streptomyces formicae TaxID=1616117 RepID=A0ABY3WP13_9ACTN|nr:hypothetical protein [Streptomyces formicae]UNM12320.1 hypothetical protein J4032_12945 [Streptomyces formicae]